MYDDINEQTRAAADMQCRVIQSST